jgi:hypothetical protein
MSAEDDLPPAIAESLRNMQRIAAERKAAGMQVDEQDVPELPWKIRPPRMDQLPFWPEARRAAPNAVFRSALFPALNFQRGRPYLQEQEIPSVRGVKIIFTGKRLDQSDLDVYLELLDLARSHPLGDECIFTAKGMLKRLGRSTGKSDRKWLHSVLIRLTANAVEIADHDKRYFGPLLGGGRIKDEIATRYYRINVNPTFAVLFGFAMWASIDRDQRRTLGRNATAKALHAYYSSHVTPGAHSIETLGVKVAGLENERKGQRRTIIKAHELLKQKGFLRDYSVSEDAETINVSLHPTPGQTRHIVANIIEDRHKRSRSDGVQRGGIACTEKQPKGG